MQPLTGYSYRLRHRMPLSKTTVTGVYLWARTVTGIVSRDR